MVKTTTTNGQLIPKKATIINYDSILETNDDSILETNDDSIEIEITPTNDTTEYNSTTLKNDTTEYNSTTPTNDTTEYNSTTPTNEYTTLDANTTLEPFTNLDTSDTNLSLSFPQYPYENPSDSNFFDIFSDEPRQRSSPTTSKISKTCHSRFHRKSVLFDGKEVKISFTQNTTIANLKETALAKLNVSDTKMKIYRIQTQNGRPLNDEYYAGEVEEEVLCLVDKENE